MYSELLRAALTMELREQALLLVQDIFGIGMVGLRAIVPLL